MLVIAIYLIGTIPAYFFLRSYCFEYFGDYTIGDRKLCMFLSLSSWLGVLSVIVIKGIIFILDTDDERPAKW